MKAVVMDSENGRSIILTDLGEFKEIEGAYDIGYEFEYQDERAASALKPISKIASVMNSRHLIRAAMAACLILTLSAGMYTLEVQSAYATVSLGEGISVEYKLDKGGNVVDIRATDESGEELASQLEELGVRGKGIEEALADAKKIIDDRNIEEYERTGDESKAVTLAPVVNSRNDVHRSKIEDRVDKAEKDLGIKANDPTPKDSGKTGSDIEASGNNEEEAKAEKNSKQPAGTNEPSHNTNTEDDSNSNNSETSSGKSEPEPEDGMTNGGSEVIQRNKEAQPNEDSISGKVDEMPQEQGSVPKQEPDSKAGPTGPAPTGPAPSGMGPDDVAPDAESDRPAEAAGSAGDAGHAGSARPDETSPDQQTKP